MVFRTALAETIFQQKYAHSGCETWPKLAKVLAEDVCGGLLPKDTVNAIAQLITEMKFIPGGRYLYYAGRSIKAFNNCFLLRAEEDTREDWADLSWKAESCLMTGGGIGVDYSRYRESGRTLSRTGGTASGPIPKMMMINEIGRHVMQGGSRRSAIYASLNWEHGDIHQFLTAKNWDHMQVPGTSATLKDLKAADYNWPAPLDMTNISVNYDDAWLGDRLSGVFMENVSQALRTGEPGFSFNFGDKQNETLRNAPVSADTWVLTDTGIARVGDIADDEAMVWTGKRWVPTVFHRTKKMVQTIAVSMTGGRVIKADPEHEFFVERYKGAGKRRRLDSVDKVRADALQPGDVLHVSLPEPVKLPLRRQPYLFGYVYGDGSFTKRYPQRAEVTFCTEESKACAAAIDLASHPYVLSVNGNDSRGFIRAYLKDNWFIDRDKAIFPDDVEVDDLASFFAGLFDADGSFDPTQRRVRLSSVHYNFLDGARRALERLGIQAHINLAGKSTYGQRQGYLLVIAADSIGRFAEVVPTQRLKIITEGWTPYRRSTIKVLSVTLGPVEDVFCCDVGVEEHSFCAEGVIISNCTEVTSEDDSDVCNLGSLNMSRIETLDDFEMATALATAFLLCGTLRADLPYEKVYKVREKNRRLGLGLMGVHEWLLQRGHRYEVVPELHRWLDVYEEQSDKAARGTADRLGVSRPVAVRAIAPTGTIGILAGTTTGIEPLFATAYKRRYLKNGTQWHYQMVVDGTAKVLVESNDLDPEKIESAVDLAADPERRIAFQADVQDYVDQSISSTINLPAWGSDLNNEDKVVPFAKLLAEYAPRLRGFTVYPDGSRGGQPLTPVPYYEAMDWAGVEFEDNDSCKGGTCGL